MKDKSFRFACKCRECGLHFNVYTWYKDWDTRETTGGFCPECGKQSLLILARETLDTEIFEHVSATLL